jgi:hypothetical protein
MSATRSSAELRLADCPEHQAEEPEQRDENGSDGRKYRKDNAACPLMHAGAENQKCTEGGQGSEHWRHTEQNRPEQHDAANEQNEREQDQPGQCPSLAASHELVIDSPARHRERC